MASILTRETATVRSKSVESSTLLKGTEPLLFLTRACLLEEVIVNIEDLKLTRMRPLMEKKTSFLKEKGLVASVCSPSHMLSLAISHRARRSPCYPKRRPALAASRLYYRAQIPSIEKFSSADYLTTYLMKNLRPTSFTMVTLRTVRSLKTSEQGSHVASGL